VEAVGTCTSAPQPGHVTVLPAFLLAVLSFFRQFRQRNPIGITHLQRPGRSAR
jgi:hypothetical protein